MTLLIVITIAALVGLSVDALMHLRDLRTPRSPLDDVLRLARIERRGWKSRTRGILASGVPTAVLTSENFATLVTPGLRKIFHARLRAYDELFKRTQIFPIDSSTRQFEEYQGIGELGVDAWNNFEKTGRTSRDDFEAAWKTRLEHREFTAGVDIRRKLVDDNLYPGAGIPKSLTQRVEKLADSAAIHRERSGANVFNNAFTDTGVDQEGFSVSGADGVGLCSTAHPATPGNPSTQSNEGTLAFTAANVRATRLLMRKLKDDKGNPIALKPDTVLIPPDLEDKADVIFGSDQEPGGANNDVNNLRGKYTPVVWDYLTDPTAWFLIDSVLKGQHLVWLDRVLPEFNQEKDTDTQIFSWTGYHRFSRGWSSPWWVFGQKP